VKDTQEERQKDKTGTQIRKKVVKRETNYQKKKQTRRMTTEKKESPSKK
jgi:hypothetical protein